MPSSDLQLVIHLACLLLDEQQLITAIVALHTYN